MRRPFILFTAFCLLCASSLAQKVFYFPQVGDARVDSIIFKTTFIFVNTGADATIKIEFFKSDGTPMTLTLGNLGSNSVFDNISLKRGESISLQTPGSDAGVRVGYAKITTGTGVGGTAVFTRLDAPTGLVMYEAGVAAATALSNFSIFLDSLGDRDTGLAMVNTGSSEVGVALTLYNKSFTRIATTDVPLGGGKHQAKFIWEIFTDFSTQAREMEGSVTVAGVGLTAVTLRTNDNGQPFPQQVPALTTFPVISGAADTTSSGSFSLLAGGDVGISLNLSPGEPRVMGGVYRLYEGEQLVYEVVRTIQSVGLIHELIALPARQRRPHISRVEVQLIHEGGHLGQTLEINP